MVGQRTHLGGTPHRGPPVRLLGFPLSPQTVRPREGQVRDVPQPIPGKPRVERGMVPGLHDEEAAAGKDGVVSKAT